jgi:hypothetical protein
VCPNGPRLEPGTEANKESAKKRKDDAGAGPADKHTKVSGWKVMAPRAFVLPSGSGAPSSKMALTKAILAPHTKYAPKASAPPRANAPPKVGAPTKTVVSKSVVAVAMSKAGVLRISTRMKRPSSDSMWAPKGKQARVDVPPPLASVATHKL